MRRYLFILTLLCFVSQAMSQDVITKKDGIVIKGQVKKRANSALAIKTLDGIMTVVQIKDIASIQRGDILMDLQTQIRYRLEKRRPYIPFLFLTAGATALGIREYQNYKDKKDEAENESYLPDDIQNLNDKSKRHLATSIISGVVAIGSAYVALRPVEVRTPLGPINISMKVQSNKIGLAMNF